MAITLLGHQPIDFTYKENDPCEYLSTQCLQYEIADNPQFQIKNTTGTAPLVTIVGVGGTEFTETEIPSTLYSIEGNFYTYTLNFSELGITSGCYELCIYQISSSTGVNLVTNGTFGSDISSWTAASGVSLDVDSYTSTSVTLVATGGTGPYEYSNGGTTYQASETFTGLTAGTSYTFYARDVNGVIGSVHFTIRTCGDYAGAELNDLDDVYIAEIGNCELNDFGI